MLQIFEQKRIFLPLKMYIYIIYTYVLFMFFLYVSEGHLRVMVISHSHYHVVGHIICTYHLSLCSKVCI